jgi:uncharacterized membrane protein SirB2
LLPLATMRRPPTHDPLPDNVLLLTLLTLLLFASPMVFWWTDADSPWYWPYLLWLIVIVLGARVFRDRSGDRHDP